ncbi:SH3 domain-containing protein [Caldalkalibacillus salinus]|uniref:SH3 domain-containing protein n=1 Tax=Caldalkalibacillus salinus TaxID=2803787 RepID=UPI0019242694|nr:SH3 domain-containing protein [Caldalkalibacillus salinus]
MDVVKIKHPSLLSALFICLLCILFPSSALAMGDVTVEANSLNVRSGPGLEHDVIEGIQKGETFGVTDESDQWYEIKLGDGQTGWVAGWLVQFTASSGEIEQVEAAVNPLNVRSGPGTSFSIKTQIHPEQTFPFVQEQGEWVQIKLNDDDTGWVAKWLVHRHQAEADQATTVKRTATIKATTLNVRAQPSTSANIIGTLNQGSEIEVLGANDGWYKIIYQNQEAWVAGDYVAEESENDQASSASGRDSTRVEVETSILNVRSNGSLEAAIIDQLSQGTIVEVIDEQNEWYHVQYDEHKGWIAKWLTSQVSDQVSNQPKVTILNHGTNLREGPSTDHKVVGRANQGDEFAVLETKGDWFQILLSDGSKAYVAGWIVSAKGIDNIEREGIDQYLKGKNIVIDPGHGGRDVGAEGSYFNTLEKVINLDVSQLLKEKFKAAGSEVKMTRASDRFITLQQRVDASINDKADVFLSIHHNTNSDSRINGSITYFHSKADRQLANYVQRELVKNNGLNDLKARQGNFFVLRENPRPSVLVEIGFLSNRQDEMKIRQSRFQEQSANGIFYGIAEYFKDQDS